MALTGFYAVLYYGILASITGGYLPVRSKNWWLIIFHLYLFLSFILLPLIIFLVSCLQTPSVVPDFIEVLIRVCVCCL